MATPGVIVTVVILTFVALIAWADQGARSAGCARMAIDAGLEGRWSFETGCQVRVRRRWVPFNLVRFDVQTGEPR